MSAKHTPGPWMLTSDNENASICASDGGLVVAGEFDGWMVPFGCREKDEAIANARLIAAAPELLEALDRLLAFHDHTHPKHEFVHDEYYEACIANEVAPSGSGLLDQLQHDARTAIAKATGTTE